MENNKDQQNSTRNKNFPKFNVQNLSNYVLGLSVLLYLAGFLITNMFFSSFGIVNLEILKTRYITTGATFLIFVGILFYLFKALFETLIQNDNRAIHHQIWEVFVISYKNIFVLIFLIIAFSHFSGYINNESIRSFLDPDFPISDWLQSSPSVIFQDVNKFFVFAIISILSVFIFILIILLISKNKDQSLKKVISDFFKNFFEMKFAIIKYVFGFYIFLYLYFGLSSIFTYLIRNGNGETNYKLIAIPYQIAWFRYLIAIIIVYLLCAIFISFIFMVRTESNTNKSGNQVSKHSSLIFVAAIFVMIIFPIYSKFVYPYLPQHIGGGKPVEISINYFTDELNNKLKSIDKIYLIDKSNNSTILMLIDLNDDYHIFEIDNDQIISINYFPIE